MAVFLIPSAARAEYPTSNADYEELEQEVGCKSKYSSDKKRDVFNSRYKNHWMIWSGEVVSASSDWASLNTDGFGSSDLRVYFADKGAGYDLLEGDWISVKFVMESAGGCFLPFIGKHAILME